MTDVGAGYEMQEQQPKTSEKHIRSFENPKYQIPFKVMSIPKY